MRGHRIDRQNVDLVSARRNLVPPLSSPDRAAVRTRKGSTALPPRSRRPTKAENSTPNSVCGVTAVSTGQIWRHSKRRSCYRKRGKQSKKEKRPCLVSEKRQLPRNSNESAKRRQPTCQFNFHPTRRDRAPWVTSSWLCSRPHSGLGIRAIKIRNLARHGIGSTLLKQ